MVFLIPVLVAVVAVFLMPLDKRFAYNFVEGECANRAKWIHDRLFENEAPIDVAFIGSSVGWGLFDDAALSRMLSEEKGKPVNVVNLSYCRPGFNIRELFVEELLKAKSPKHIVIELRWLPSRGGHPVYGYLAETEMLLNPPTHLYQPYLTDLKRAETVRWEKVRSCLQPEEPYRVDRDSFGVATVDILVDQEHMKKEFARHQKLDPKEPESPQETIHYHVYWKNLEHIKTLCEQRGVRLTFFYVNQFGNPVTYPKHVERLESIAPIWYAPDSIFQNPKYYSDVVHYNEKGTDAVTPVLYEYLRQYDY